MNQLAIEILSHGIPDLERRLSQAIDEVSRYKNMGAEAEFPELYTFWVDSPLDEAQFTRWLSLVPGVRWIDVFTRRPYEDIPDETE